MHAEYMKYFLFSFFFSARIQLGFTLKIQRYFILITLLTLQRLLSNYCFLGGFQSCCIKRVTKKQSIYLFFFAYFLLNKGNFLTKIGLFQQLQQDGCIAASELQDNSSVTCNYCIKIMDPKHYGIILIQKKATLQQWP